MADKERISQHLTQGAAGVNIPTIQRHISQCAEQTQPKCCSEEEATESWKYLKHRLAELRLQGRVYRTKPNSLRVRERPPITVLYPEAVSYHSAPPQVLERII